jgi:hypothetical protein
MSDEKINQKDQAEMENLEIEPLSDEDLESVPGGALSQFKDCSCGSTGGNCTA